MLELYTVLYKNRYIYELLGVSEDKRAKFTEWAGYIIGSRDDNFWELNNYNCGTFKNKLNLNLWLFNLFP